VIFLPITLDVDPLFTATVVPTNEQEIEAVGAKLELWRAKLLAYV
jgi:hypothetical protein